jgi:hypothetical protein
LGVGFGVGAGVARGAGVAGAGVAVGAAGAAAGVEAGVDAGALRARARLVRRSAGIAPPTRTLGSLAALGDSSAAAGLPDAGAAELRAPRPARKAPANATAASAPIRRARLMPGTRSGRRWPT